MTRSGFLPAPRISGSRNALQAQIGQLRRVFGPGAIVTTEAGYALDVGSDEVDVVRFEQLVAEGRRLAADGEMVLASAALGEALGLPRGEPLAEFTYAGFFDAERARLDELILVAIETRAGADLALGRHGELAAELEALCRVHPLRERLWELLILALYQGGRQAEVLRGYAEVRDRLVGELGIDPGPALRQLQARILAQDPSLAPASAAASPVPARAAAPPKATGSLRERLSSFVGRDAELEQLREALRRSRLVTLTGPGGAGKTRLAVEAAAALREEHQDGAWLVELASVAQAGEVAPATASALEASAFAGPQPAGSTTQLIVRHLAGRSLLVVLDNCEHVIGEAAALADTLVGAVPGLRLIATSREPVGIPGEVLLPVGGLAPPGAVELFADRARAVRPGFLADGQAGDVIEDICRRLDGLPLAYTCRRAWPAWPRCGPGKVTTLQLTAFTPTRSPAASTRGCRPTPWSARRRSPVASVTCRGPGSCSTQRAVTTGRSTCPRAAPCARGPGLVRAGRRPPSRRGSIRR